MDTLLLIGTVTIGTPLVAGVIMAIGAALEPGDAAAETRSSSAER